MKINPAARVTLKLRSPLQLNTSTDSGLYEYASSNPSIVKVDGNGLLTPVSAGMATVTVKLTDGSGLVSSALVNVTP